MTLVKSLITTLILGIAYAIAGMFGNWLWREVLEDKFNNMKKHAASKSLYLHSNIVLLRKNLPHLSEQFLLFLSNLG